MDQYEIDRIAYWKKRTIQERKNREHPTIYNESSLEDFVDADDVEEDDEDVC
jgi:hypothetical protein